MNKKVPIPLWVWKTMKISTLQLLLFTLCCGIAHAHISKGQNVLERNISIHADNLRLVKVLSLIEEQTNVRFVYSPSAIDSRQRVSVNATNKKLEAVLKEFLHPLSVEFSVVEERILLKRAAPKQTGLAEPESDVFIVPEVVDRTVTGEVNDEKGVGLPGVSILIKGTQQGMITNENGSFSIVVPDNDAVLVFSFVGYLSQEVVVGNQTSITVSLEVDEKSLEEVVVVGYGTQRKSDLTGSVSVVDMNQLRKMPATNLGQQLQGRAAGVAVSSQGAPGSPTMIRIRGIGTVNNNGPLYVIDGVSTRNQNLNSINPNDIESVQVLKDASSASIYGAQASNGVIIITTKKGKSGKPQINYETFYSSSSPNKAYHMLNSRERIELMWQSKLNAASIRNIQPYLSHPQFGSGMNPQYPKYIIPQGSNEDYTTKDWTETNRVTRYSDGTDWYKKSTRRALTQSHQLTFSGANESANYLFGLNYLRQNGIFNHTSHVSKTFFSVDKIS